MFTFASDFWSSKTTWTAISAIAAAITAAVNHQITWQNAAVMIFTALLAAFHRDTVAKAAETTADFHSDMVYLYTGNHDTEPATVEPANTTVEPVDGEVDHK